MKLHTLTLPTGEFILVASSVQEVSGEQLADGFENVVKHSGAASFFCTSEAVDVEDAVIDESAVRHEWPAEHPDPDPFHLEGISTRDAIDQVLAEMGYTPAGLVDHRKLCEQVDEVLSTSPRIDTDVMVGVEEANGDYRGWYGRQTIPGQFGAGVYTGPREHTIDDVIDGAGDWVCLGVTDADGIIFGPAASDPEVATGEPSLACQCYPHGNDIDKTFVAAYGRCGNCPVQKDT